LAAKSRRALLVGWERVSTPGSRQEVEIKLRLADAATGRRLLRKAGFRVSRRRAHEDNLLFDTPARALRAKGAVLRLRRCGRQATLTYKGPASVVRYKSRLELETSVADASAAERILALLGFVIVFRYQKYRTEYQGGHSGVLATLDETPVGVFIELEGRPRSIDQAARRLGFKEVDYITYSYASLYQSARKAEARRAGIMGDQTRRV
jgi:adenylate cyclase class 2